MAGEAERDLAVIIVGVNAREYVRGCVKSLTEAVWRERTHEVIYVDNGSTDDTLAMLENDFPDVKVIANPVNRGFCKAANQGARAANARYYYFINDDTLVVGDALALLVDYCDAHPEAGTVGSRLVFPDGTEQWSGRAFPGMIEAIFGRRSYLSKWFPNLAPVRDYLCKEQVLKGAPFEVDWVSAAGQIVRRDTFERIGGFAEDYYYWHELVFCDRIAATGKRVVLHPGSKVVHYEGKGSGPRPYARQRFHVIDFHVGAYRSYCELHRLGRLHPMRWLAAAALAARGLAFLIHARITTLGERTS